jgi:SAM-dependent methyltransferase
MSPTTFADPTADLASTLAGYVRDPVTGVWSRPGHVGLSYSDGEAAESELMAIVSAARDRSTDSPELAAAIHDWITEYHLSLQRTHLLRPLRLARGQTLVELGAGCGALTRYLGETGAAVIAVEGSAARASIAAARCADLPNVGVVCDSLEALALAGAFDVALMIGVLEYAPVFGHGADPVHDTLAKAHALLRAGGTLVLAIENQLGLKYFAGCAEDHLGEPFGGVCDRYASDGPVTFGKRELEMRLGDAGFTQREFLAPFPDYKLPAVIVAPAATTRPEFSLGDLLVRAVSRDYRGARDRAFLETLAWAPIVRNGLLFDLANSFLVLATKDGGAPAVTLDPTALAWTYSHPRHREFKTETQFAIAGNEIVARKHLLGHASPKPLPADSMFTHRPSGSNYVVGSLLLPRLLRLAEGIRIPQLDAELLRWINFLLVCSGTPAQPTDIDAASITLPGEFIDAIPGNVVIRSDGTPTLFDLEWTAREPIPFAWVVLRGIAHTLSLTVDYHRHVTESWFAMAQRLLQLTHVRLVESDWATAVEWERRLVRFAVYLDHEMPASLPIEGAMRAPTGAYSGVFPRAGQRGSGPG